MLDFAFLDVQRTEIATAERERRRLRGQMAYLSGVAAEESVETAYRDNGYGLRDRRWRGKTGEIDLVFEKDGLIVFTEVKKARSFEAALERLRPPQIARLQRAMAEYLAAHGFDSFTDLRFDLALVDATGQVQVMPNILADMLV